MKWTKASEKLPKFEELIYVRIDGVIQKLGNFYEDENKKWFFHVSSQGDVPGWEIPADMFGGIEWLCESEQDEGWVPVGERLPEKYKQVLIFEPGPNGSDYIITASYWDGTYSLCGKYAQFPDGQDEQPGYYWPTHWQPRPTPPATKD